jgi:hypothetical protein
LPTQTHQHISALVAEIAALGAQNRKAAGRDR